jgi:hypothetical protein
MSFQNASIRVTSLLSLLAGLNGCENHHSSELRVSELTNAKTMDIKTPPGVMDPPKTLCTDAPPTRVKGSGVAMELLTDDDDDTVLPRDIEAFGNQIYALDKAMPAVFVYNTNGKLVGQFGRKGRGPGEFEHGMALDIDNTGKVYVLDGVGAIHIYESDGRFIRAFKPHFVASDFAVLPSGQILLARGIYVGTTLSKPLPYAVITDENGRTTRTLLTVSLSDLGKRPLPLPVQNVVRVTESNGYVAVWYPYDNSADIFKGDLLKLRIRGCVPNEYYESFDSQRRNGVHGYQAAFQLLSGVYITKTGAVTLFHGATVDDKSRVSVFDPAGQPYKVYEMAPIGDLHIHRAVTIVDGPGNIITYNDGGDINLWTLPFVKDMNL